jgi:hypothetical protein
LVVPIDREREPIMPDNSSAEIDIYNSVGAFDAISRAELDTPVTFDQAMAEAELTLNDSEIVSPFEVIEKDNLVSVPFLARHMKFRDEMDSEYGGPYVIVYAVTSDNRNVVFADGGTGIYEQARRLVEQRMARGIAKPFDNMLFSNGLRKSEYRVGDDNKPLRRGSTEKGRAAATYYFA